MIEEEQRIHEEEARRSELTQEEIWELEELERQREEEEEQRREYALVSSVAVSFLCINLQLLN